MTCLGEPDQSIALAGSSPLTTSTGCGTSIAPTNKELVVEEPEEEGRRGRGEGGAEEEEVGRDKEDIINLIKS